MTTVPAIDPPAAATRVVRIETRPIPGEPDALAAPGTAALASTQDELPGCTGLHAAQVYLIEAPLGDDQAGRVAHELLADPVNQRATLGVAPVADHHRIVEVHYLPGVMDPVAMSTRSAIAEMFPQLDLEAIDARTGVRYDFAFAPDAPTPADDALRTFAQRHLANTVIQAIELSPYLPEAFEHGHPYDFQLTHVPIRDLDDEALMKMSREAHLFLSLAEMQAVRDYYRQADREPTDVELETLAQTWSEHCVHKTLKSTIHYQHDGEPGDANDIFRNLPNTTLSDDGSVTIANLLKSTVAAATFKLKEDPDLGDWLVSVFDDNAGIVKLDDTHGIAIKVETHNHPSAIEPYGGAATGIGGCIRDVMGTGLAALPIANTDTFCVAPPDTDPASLPAGVIHPKRILQRVVDGVRDYGNRMGIPTVNGAVYFHEDYLGNPLVYAGCVGLIPLDKCFGSPNPGDLIVILGGRTGRDGIHGATFSSAELTDTHADEFSHAVQIGNAITEKQTLDVIMQARDYTDPDTGQSRPLFTAISDCGAGGFSSAVGEMGEKVGAVVHLERAPLKYRGLSYTEIWISEAQERMPLAVPPQNLDALKAIAEKEHVELCVLGQFGHTHDGSADGTPTLSLNYRGTEVGRLAMPFLHDGIPTPTRSATWAPHLFQPAPGASASARGSAGKAPASDAPGELGQTLHALLAHPNIASKHWIVRQYDHEVQAGSTVKPLVGPGQDGPSDAAVIRPKFDANRAIALGVGMAPALAEKSIETGLAEDGDSYHAALAALDEAVRNVVCVGASPAPAGHASPQASSLKPQGSASGGIAILDNFCWPNCDDPRQLGTLVRAAAACYHGALAYRTPFVSGKDSLSNQFTTDAGRVITIPQTLLITAMGIVPDATRCLTMDAKRPGNVLLIVGQTTPDLGGSHAAMLGEAAGTRRIPRVDLAQGPANARAVAELIAERLVASAHDCSDGGLLVAAAEMAFAGRVGLSLDLQSLPASTPMPPAAACFAETPSRYLLEVEPGKLDAVVRKLQAAGVPFAQIGLFNDHTTLTARTPDGGQILSEDLDTLRTTWQKPLDW